MRDLSKAKLAFENALQVDKNSTSAMQGFIRCFRPRPAKCTRAWEQFELALWIRATNDPEVRQILSDPSMRQIYERMQTNPNEVRK